MTPQTLFVLHNLLTLRFFRSLKRQEWVFVHLKPQHCALPLFFLCAPSLANLMRRQPGYLISSPLPKTQEHKSVPLPRAEEMLVGVAALKVSAVLADTPWPAGFQKMTSLTAPYVLSVHCSQCTHLSIMRLVWLNHLRAVWLCSSSATLCFVPLSCFFFVLFCFFTPCDHFLMCRGYECVRARPLNFYKWLFKHKGDSKGLQHNSVFAVFFGLVATHVGDPTMCIALRPQEEKGMTFSFKYIFWVFSSNIWSKLHKTVAWH